MQAARSLTPAEPVGRCRALRRRLKPEMVAGRALASEGSFLARMGTHGLGHFRSLGRQDNRVANDRSQSTADVAQRPISVTHSPKRSIIAVRRKPASRADRMAASYGLELALPTLCRHPQF